jgi:hypothetical protein
LRLLTGLRELRLLTGLRELRLLTGLRELWLLTGLSELRLLTGLSELRLLTGLSELLLHAGLSELLLHAGLSVLLHSGCDVVCLLNNSALNETNTHAILISAFHVSLSFFVVPLHHGHEVQFESAVQEDCNQTIDDNQPWVHFRLIIAVVDIPL